jgi:hypothetical protein
VSGIEVIIVSHNVTQKANSSTSGIASFSNLTSTYQVGIVVRNSTVHKAAQATITLVKGQNKKTIILQPINIDPNKTDAAELTVTVTSKDKKPVVGANITVTSGTKSLKSVTNSNGSVVITNLTAGKKVAVFVKANSSFNSK